LWEESIVHSLKSTAEVVLKNMVIMLSQFF
jgi:hypothetical protein